MVEWIAARVEVSDEFFDLPEMVQAALEVLGRDVGIDGRQRAQAFPAESQRFRLARLEAAGLTPRALKQLRSVLAGHHASSFR